MSKRKLTWRDYNRKLTWRDYNRKLTWRDYNPKLHSVESVESNVWAESLKRKVLDVFAPETDKSRLYCLTVDFDKKMSHPIKDWDAVVVRDTVAIVRRSTLIKDGQLHLRITPASKDDFLAIQVGDTIMVIPTNQNYSEQT